MHKNSLLQNELGSRTVDIVVLMSCGVMYEGRVLHVCPEGNHIDMSVENPPGRYIVRLSAEHIVAVVEPQYAVAPAH